MSRYHNILNTDPTAMTYSEVLLRATNFYHALKEQGEWIVKNKMRHTQAQFFAQGNLVPLPPPPVLPNRQQQSDGNSKFHRPQNAWNRQQLTQQASQTTTNNNETPNKKWREVPPPPNTPKHKRINEKDFFWCTKCNRWTSTHTNETHRVGIPRQQGTNNMNPNNNNNEGNTENRGRRNGGRRNRRNNNNNNNVVSTSHFSSAFLTLDEAQINWQAE
jgi:hypothetical protein